jgi:hypothetical protein
VNADHQIVGVATIFGQRAYGGTMWQPEEFERWLAMEMGLPVRLDHGAILDSRGGILNIGRAGPFAVIRRPVFGLLACLELDEGPWQDALLEDIRQHLESPYLRPYGLSIGAHRLRGEVCLPYEISITQQPGFAQALILGIGEQAQAVWSLLTEPILNGQAVQP